MLVCFLKLFPFPSDIYSKEWIQRSRISSVKGALILPGQLASSPVFPPRAGHSLHWLGGCLCVSLPGYTEAPWGQRPRLLVLTELRGVWKTLKYTLWENKYWELFWPAMSFGIWRATKDGKAQSDMLWDFL